MKPSTLIASATTAALFIGSASAANVILNGGFELGTGSDADHWNEINSGSNVFNGRATTDPATGIASARQSYDFSTTAGGPALILQQVGTPSSITPGMIYDLSFDAKVDNLDFTGVNFQLGLFLGDDAVLPGNIGGFMSLNPSLTTDYQKITFNGLVAGAGTLYNLQFLTAPGTVPGIVNGLSIDNVVLVAVPEPTALGLLGVGLLAGVTRRRRA